MKELEALANRIESMGQEIESKKEEIASLTKRLERWESKGAYETTSMEIKICTDHPYSVKTAIDEISQAIRIFYRAELITSVFESIDYETDASYMHVGFNKNLRILGMS